MVKLLRRGWTKQAIADKFGVDRTTISHDWGRVLQSIQADMQEEGELAVQGLLERNNEVEREAWEAWERSRQARQEVINTEATGGRGDSASTTTKTTQQVGDPRFLQIVQSCHETERELRDLVPAVKVNMDGTLAVGVFPWDALRQVASGQARLGKGTDGKPRDPFGDMIAAALGAQGMPAAETVLEHVSAGTPAAPNPKGG